MTNPEEKLSDEITVRDKVDQQQIKHFISEIKSAEQQVGEHIIAALQDDETVAVLTTVVIGPDGRQRIVSAGLDPDLMQQVQEYLSNAQKQRTEEIPCIGFHCLLKRREEEEALALEEGTESKDVDDETS